MSILEFPKKSGQNIVNGYISRLDVQNSIVEEAVFIANQAGANMMYQMQSYLRILQDFIKEATGEEIMKFLKEKGREHNLDLDTSNNVSFQLELF